ncbi:MAG: hypothetical protein JWO80_6394 [Bryobacterales bacterium]|nr:hypothetical protein [Bryobacterales bacterium]
MQRFAVYVPDLFARMAVGMLVTASNSPGYRYLETLLVRHRSLFQQLSNPCGFTRPQAVLVSRRLMALDPTFDIRFAHQLPARNGATPDTLLGQHAERALDILDEISAGRRVVPIVSHLANHADSKISSKAALLVGKRVQNVAFSRRLIAEGNDPRVRANAIEGIWGDDTRPVRDLFRDCVRDCHNRVVGNALVGLYLAGEEAISDVMKRFAHDYKPDFRMSSAWAMGRTEDADFIPTLSPLVQDDHPGVRAAAERSLQNIRQIEKVRRPSETPPGENLSQSASGDML